MSVNVSSSNLLDPGFIDVVKATLRRHRVPASALILEMTETTIIRDFAACQSVIEELRSLGMGVSIDDFGSGIHIARVSRQPADHRAEARPDIHR